MVEISKEEAIEFLEYLPNDISIQGNVMTVAKWTMANAMGADALKKLKKIEEIVEDFMHQKYEGTMAISKKFIEIEQIVHENHN